MDPDALHPDVARALDERAERWAALLARLTMPDAPGPRVEQEGAALYFVDADGERWRVHDAMFSGGRPHRVRLGDSRARYRYFVRGDGLRRVADLLLRGASRALDADTLAAQLRGAEYVARERYTPPDDAPGRAGG